MNGIYTNEDCMDLMARYPDRHFDLAIVDPPYGIGEDGGRNYTRESKAISKNYKSFSGGDSEPASKEYFTELFRISKNLIIFGANHFIENLPRQNSSCWIVWDKDNGQTDFADCELAWTSFKSAVRKFKYRWNGMLQENHKNKQIRIHPTEKPIALYEWLLTNYAKPNDLILDTHCGSASSLIACEKDSHYFEESMKRLQTHLSLGKLFNSPLKIQTERGLF